MKKLLALFLFGLITISAKSQSTQNTKNDILKDSIVSKFNRDDYEGIYAMANREFKKNIKSGVLINLLKDASSLGKIKKTEKMYTDTTNVSTYRLFHEKKSLRLSIKALSHSSYDVFGLTFYQLPINQTRNHYPSDNSLKTRLDSVVQNAVNDYMRNENVAGLSVGVLRNGEMFIYNFGETAKGSNKLPSVETIYEIGSITKTFTGIILAHAVKEGKVKLNDDIRIYLSGKFSELQFKGQPIQLVHLSNHTSGLPSQPKIVGTGKDPFDPSETFSEKVIADILQNISLDAPPGTRSEYSNFAVSLLGYILEKVYQQSYEQLLETYIFKPYKMTQSKIALIESDYKKFAQGYDVEGSNTKFWRNKLAEPAGGIRSTTNDMLLYIQEQLKAENGSAAWLSHQLTWGDNKRGKGLNWGISTTKKGYKVWSHDGGTYGFTSLCLIYPELNSGIILLTNNGNHDDQSFYDIGKSIYLSWVK
ncbi:MAG: serine hydrolase domain-containing protein [Cyclobacteriaceae bacterium]